MKSIRILSIIIASIIIGGSFAVSAGEIDSGSIDVTINDDVYGTVSPDINIDDTSITLSALEIIGGEENNYQVQDNITIPINVLIEKEKVYMNKMISGRVKLYRSFFDTVVKEPFSEYVAQGEFSGTDLNLSDEISVPASYIIDNETFENGEELVMCVLVMGRRFPGRVADSVMLFDLDNLISGNGLIGRIINEFFSLNTTIGMKLQILTFKQVHLQVTYEYGGQQVQPNEFTINATVAQGQGSIRLDPDQASYEEGTNVTLTAVPGAGYVFDHWEGDLTGSENPQNLTMDSNKTVQAFFEASPIFISPSGFGLFNAKINILNQETTNISFDWNVSIQGGLLRRINLFTNGTIDDLPANESATVQCGRLKFLGLGPVVVTVNVDRPGEDVITEQFAGTVLGPLIFL